MMKIGNYFNLFASRFCNMFLYTALLFNQRGLLFMSELYPALSPALIPHFQVPSALYLMGKSHTTLCLSLLSSSPLDCELLEGLCLNHCYTQRLAPSPAHQKYSINI